MGGLVPDRRGFLAGATATAAGFTASAADRAPPPNVLFILADDLGYADLSCYGSRHIRTPVLDRLAASGARFTDAYANTAVCSPTRLALITGRYQCRFPGGVIEPFSAGPWGEGAIPDGYPTLPKRLKRLGYSTALVGKWHLGLTPAVGPLAHGYDTFFGITPGGADYFTHEYNGANVLFDGAQLTSEPGYLTTVFANRAIERLRGFARSPKQPFLLSLHFNAPHWPWEGPDDTPTGVTRGGDYDAGSLKTYAAMVEAMDHEIGRVLDSLDTLGLARDTIVIFTSDNGGERFSEVWPFRGEKSSLLEGGIRTPLIVRRPGVTKPGTVTRQAAITMDLTASILDAAGAPADSAAPLDGISLWPMLAGGRTQQRTLFWRYTGHNQAALRDGSLKYYRTGAYEFMFDLSVDSFERANLAAKLPDQFRTLKAKWAALNAEMVPEQVGQGYCLPPRQLAGELQIIPGDGCRQGGAPG